MADKKALFDKKQIKDDLNKAVSVWKNNLDRVEDQANAKEKVVIQKAKQRAEYVEGELAAGNWSETLTFEAMGSIDRTLANELEAIQDKANKDRRSVTVASAISGGIGMILGVLGGVKF